MSKANNPLDGPLRLVDATGNANPDWIADGKHSFMFPGGRDADPVNVILDLRSGIARLPETTTLFILDRVLDQYNPKDVRPEYLALCGSWRAPESIVGNANGNTNPKYVNPAGADKHLYADTIVRCECGTAFNQNMTAGPNLPGSEDHADDCKPQHHYDGLAEVWRRREQVAKAMLLLGTWTGRDVARRIGIAETQVRRFTEKCNFSVTEYRQRGRRLLANTATELRETHSPAAVACAYNYSKGRMRRVINKYADDDVDHNAVNDRRRENDRRDEWVPRKYVTTDPGGDQP